MRNDNGFQQDEQFEWENTAPGVKRKILAYNNDLMMVKVQFEKGAVGDAHNHPHLQSSYVADGSFEVTIDGKTQLLKKGDSFFVESNLVHGVVCKEAGLLIDVFNPCRKDFL